MITSRVYINWKRSIWIQMSGSIKISAKNMIKFVLKHFEYIFQILLKKVFRIYINICIWIIHDNSIPEVFGLEYFIFDGLQ